MTGRWTFSRRLALGFAAIVVAFAIVAITGLRTTQSLAADADLVAHAAATTVEATREIELSTKQQTSAVEQVHVAIAGPTQTTRETEAGATQTLQTSSQLTSLSTSLTRLVQAT